jgi:hypothetical protein
MSKTSTPLSTFTLFPELPYDLRYMIWMTARPGPRLVYLHSFHLKSFKCHRVWSDCRASKRGNKRFFREDNYETDEQKLIPCCKRTNIEPCTGFKSYEPSIPLLAACRESYSIFSQFYTRAFGSAAAFPETWFDIERDTLYLDIWSPTAVPDYPRYLSQPAPGGEARYMPEHLGLDAERVQTLAVDSLKSSRFDYQVWLARILQHFKNVGKIFFVKSSGYRGPEEVDLVLEDPKEPQLRNILWQGYKGNYDPIVERLTNKRYEEELSNIAAGARDYPDEFTRLKRTWVMDEHMPDIELKSVTYGWIIDGFHEDKRKYQRQKEGFRMVINARTRGKKNLRLLLQESTTIKEMVAMSRKEWDLPEEKVCEGVFDENHVELSTESLVCDVIWRESHDWEIRFRWAEET